MSADQQNWVEPPHVEVPKAIRDQIGEPAFLAETLVRRGITDAQRLREFLDSSQYVPADPDALPDLPKAVDRIEHAVSIGETIGVWGDFDVDGQTATSLLVQTLQFLGAKVKFFIPNRERDSHGVALPALETFLASGVDLVLTCDTGISAHDAVSFAGERGIDFIITDHHSLPDTLPPAVAVVNSQRLAPGAPLAPLCGVGCAYKLAEALLVRSGNAAKANELLDLVALGTVADLALLTGDNRFLVQRGLESMRVSPRPAIEAILELSNVSPDQITEEQISFIIAPRLNALGRLDDANPAVPFFLAKSLAEARPMAARLEGLNARRKLLCDQVFQAAQAQLERDHSLLEHPVVLLGHPAWPGGVLGIVASRLTEIYHKPFILLTTPPGQHARGSARSIEGVNITHAISGAQHLLNSFGAHPMAAGLSLDPGKITEVHRLIDSSVRSQQSQEHQPAARLVIDAYLPFDELSLEMVTSLDRLAPFGPGNPGLILAARNLALQSHVQFGKNNEHLQLIVEDAHGSSQKVVWWQGTGLPLPQDRFDMAYTVRASNYRGQPMVQVVWVGFRNIMESVTLRKQHAVRDIVDYRNELDPSAKLAVWKNDPQTLIFAEGDQPQLSKAVDRNHLVSKQNLVVWTTPSGREELQALLDIVNPQKVIWYGIHPGSDQLMPFLTRLTGLVRYVMKARNGMTTISELAAATAQRERTVSAGIAWLAARGYITAETVDTAVQITSGGSADPDLVNHIEQDITYLLSETAAFRSYCQKIDLKLLIS